MSTSEAAGPSPADQVDEAGKKYLSVRQAAFIGVGAMVGAGIFALLGAAGERFDRHAGGHPSAERGPGLRVETEPPQSSGACPGQSLVR